METGNQFLGTERIGKLMRQYAIPCIISLLVGALYNIVDQIFIANASYLGSYGNAANTVVFPLTVVALAIAVMVGDGCCAFVSMALGRNEVDKAKRSAAYHRFYTNMKWGHAQNYHLTLDSGVIGIDKCVDIIAELY
mgnify:FL=1